jgi:hypothetical protein
MLRRDPAGALGEGGFESRLPDQHRGTQAVEQGAEAIVRLATIGADGPTGTFQEAAGVTDW